MKKGFGKLWLVAVVILLAALLAIPAMAAENDEPTIVAGDIAYPQISNEAYPQRQGAVNAGGYYTDALRSYLIGKFATCPSSIDISSYNIPTSKINELRGCIWYETPEAFNVYSIDYYYNSSTGKITSLVLTYYAYADTPSEYTSCWNACLSAANKILSGIEGNSALSNVEKALLIHDRLALWVEYDYENYVKDEVNLSYLPDTDFTMVGVFQNRSAVCMGYTMAYMYLLDRVGIESDYCSSDNMNHCWNVVFIGSTPYYVDVTWDDPVWDVTGQVLHTNFLRSKNGIIATGHNGGDFTINTPTSTTYDSYYWQNSETAFQLVNGSIYYIDNVAQTLKKVGSSSTIVSVSGTWYASSTSVWQDNFSRLSSCGNELLYSKPDGIYSYNTANGSNTKIYSANTSNYRGVFGFTYENGYLICEVLNTPNYDRYTKSNYQVRIAYAGADSQAPTASLSATNNLATSQTVTITMRDDRGIAGYYWGTSSSYASNTFTSTSSTTATKTVSTYGTYYLTVKDTAGNISQTYSITFYKTTMNANGGSVTPGYVITQSGKSFSLPTATRSGYTFLGWSTSSTATSATYTSGTSYTPTTSRSLYAVWREGTARNGWYTENGSTYYYVNDVRQTGWLTLDGNRYYLGNDGAARRGWAYISGNYYFFNASHVMQTGWVQSGGIWYFCKTDGRMATGWVNVGGVYYFMNSSGAMVTGWLQQGSTWYYLQPGSGAMATGIVKIGNTFYKFNSSGAWQPGVVSGWISMDGKWYYISGNTMATGWKKVGSAWYYFNASGQMQTGWQTIGGRQYYLRSSGAMAVGWAKIGNDYYYFDANGYMKTGWVKDGGKWYFLDSDGTMVTGYWEIGNETYYYFRDDGTMVTGWLTVGGEWYYFNSSGVQQFGQQTIGGKTYYFDYNYSGKMRTNTWYRVGSYYYGYKYYYFGSDGAMVKSQWLRIGGYDYYFNAYGECDRTPMNVTWY